MEPNNSTPEKSISQDVLLWLNWSACCLALLVALREDGWNPIVKSYAHSVPTAETGGMSYYGLDRIWSGLLSG